ncbi:MAG: DUF4249 family protein [bacterium]|nr:DUF4249 family protein [bacterium]
MKIRHFLLALLCAGLLFGVMGCDESTEQEYREQIVLQGYLFIHQPMSIRLSHTLPFDAFYDPSAANVSGADVTIWSFDGSETREYSLAEDTLAPGIYRVQESGVDDTVRTGSVYSIRVESGGSVLTAESGPAAPPIWLQSVYYGERQLEDYRDTVAVDTLEFGGHTEYGEPYLIFFWNHDERREASNIVVQNLVPNWYDNEVESVVKNEWPIAFWTMKEGDAFAMPWLVVGFTGLHRVTVMSCDENAYNYFMTNIPGEASNYPNSNVRGGLGLFTALDADTIYFYLKDDIEE